MRIKKAAITAALVERVATFPVCSARQLRIVFINVGFLPITVFKPHFKNKTFTQICNR